MGTLLGPLGLQNAANGGPKSIKKVTPKMSGKKSRNFMQHHAGRTPCAPLKETNKKQIGRPTGH